MKYCFLTLKCIKNKSIYKNVYRYTTNYDRHLSILYAIDRHHFIGNIYLLLPTTMYNFTFFTNRYDYIN